jgi:hypothetical protein
MRSYRIHLPKLRRGRVATCDLDIISVIKEGTSVGLPPATYSPRLIIIIFMSKRDDLLALFAAMAPEAIKKYPLPHADWPRRKRTNSLLSSTRISMILGLTSISAFISIVVLHHTEPSSAVACPPSSGRQLLVLVESLSRVAVRGNAVSWG